MSILIGLTGSIGSGKSLAATYFKELGACIIDADSLSKQLVEPGEAAWKKIAEEFGADYFNHDQSLKRKKIAAEVFKDDEKRGLLEKIIHHRVLAEEQNLYHAYKRSNPEAVVIVDSPLLIESENYMNMDKVIIIKCSTELQIQRAMERNGNYHADVKNRLKTQMPLAKKLKYADYVLNNIGTREELKSQVCTLYKELQRLV